MGKDSLGGSVEPGETWKVTYNIAPTDVRYDGKIVHVVFMTDREKQQERLEKNGVDPLQFFLKNSDSKKHVISIEILDFNNKSVFKEATYAANLSFTGKLYLNIRDDPNNPIEFSMAIA